MKTKVHGPRHRCFFAFLLAFFPAILAAQAPPARVGGEIKVNASTGYHSDGDVSVNAKGGFVVTWVEFPGFPSYKTSPDPGSPAPSTFGGGIVRAQRFSPTGTKVGGSFAVSELPGYGYAPRISGKGDGSFVVVWDSAYGLGKATPSRRRPVRPGIVGPDTEPRPQATLLDSIVARRFDSSGSPLGSSFSVQSATAFSGYSPDVSVNKNGQFVVVWTAYGDGNGSGVFGQRFQSSGSPTGTEFLVNATTTGWQGRPAVGMANDGSFIVVWDGTSDGSGSGVLGRKFSSSGVPGVEFQVNTTTSNYQSEPDVSVDATGDFVVVWDSAYQDGDGSTVVGRRFSSSGSAKGGEFIVNSYTTGGQVWPVVAADDEGSFVVAWDNPEPYGGYYSEVRAQGFKASGARSGSEFKVAGTSPFGDYRPRIESSGIGQFVVVWTRAPFIQAGKAGFEPSLFGTYSDVIAQRVQTAPPCPSGLQQISPVNAVTGPTGTLSWNDVLADSYEVYLGEPTDGCTQLLASTTSTTMPFGPLLIDRDYQWRVIARKAGCSGALSACSTFRVCPTEEPMLLAPVNDATVSRTTTLTWSAVPGASSYNLKYAVNFGPLQILNTTETSATLTFVDGTVQWFVEALFNLCSPAATPPRSFKVACPTIAGTPLPSYDSEATTGEVYTLSWTRVDQADTYEVWESRTSSFDDPGDPLPIIVGGLSTDFQHFLPEGSTTPEAWYYRIRARSSCGGSLGPFSQTVRTVIQPEPSDDDDDPDVVTEFGNDDPLIINTTLCTDENGKLLVPCPSLNKRDARTPSATSVSFSLVSSASFITVTPSSGTTSTTPTTVTLTVNPSGLDNGTHTSSVTATSTADPTNTATAPVSVSLVTPVTPGGKTAATASAVIVPAAAHAFGINSQWVSDVRVLNIGDGPVDLDVAFTLSGMDGTETGEKTSISADAGKSVALNDIIKTWFGEGSLPDENATGVLDIRPSEALGKQGSSLTPLSTVVSSRTYNKTASGTFGQFIPGIPFGKFVGVPTGVPAPSPVLSMQQIAQNDDYRTNLGIVEAFGKAVTVSIRVYDDLGNLIHTVSRDIEPAGHVQFDSFLASEGITLDGGRIEVVPMAGEGLIQAYASVVDNGTQDPILIPAVNLQNTVGSRWVLPGIADLTNDRNNWRSDVRIFNVTASPVAATLTFYPTANPQNSKSIQVSIQGGQVLELDNILEDDFQLTNTGGAIHVTTAQGASLVVTARTYDLQANGTYGQFIPGLTQADAVGAGDRPMHVLQLESSPRFRSNLGVAEVTGSAATVRVTAIAPQTLSAPSVTMSLDANEFVQMVDILKAFGLGDSYNARVMVEVIGGTGKVTSYGSVIDNATQDPTYVPGQ